MSIKKKWLRVLLKKYNVTKLVYYEIYNDSYSTISREKQIKARSRKRKIKLVEKINPEWKDLSLELNLLS